MRVHVRTDTSWNTNVCTWHKYVGKPHWVAYQPRSSKGTKMKEFHLPTPVSHCPLKAFLGVYFSLKLACKASICCKNSGLIRCLYSGFSMFTRTSGMADGQRNALASMLKKNDLMASRTWFFFWAFLPSPVSLARTWKNYSIVISPQCPFSCVHKSS